MSRAKPTLDQRDRRRARVVELTKAGHSVSQIARALKVTPHVVTMDRNAMRAHLEGVRIYNGGKFRPPEPEPYDWLSDPPPVLPPAWKAGSPMVAVRTFLAQSGNAANRLAFNVASAEADDDSDWLASAQADVAGAISRLADMQAVLTDAEARVAATRNGRDDLRPPQQRQQRQQPLPPPGAGVLPGLAYGFLWRYHWAGLPVDDEVIGLAVSQYKLSLERTREVAADLEMALGS